MRYESDMRLANLTVVFCAAALVAFVGRALAGETYRGTIYVLDGGAVHNMLVSDGGQFELAPTSRVSLQCDVAAYVCTDSATCSSAIGVKVSADVLFPTSIGKRTVATNPAGTTVSGGLVAVKPVSGATATCGVWSRRGDEN